MLAPETFNMLTKLKELQCLTSFEVADGLSSDTNHMHAYIQVTQHTLYS